MATKAELEAELSQLKDQVDERVSFNPQEYKDKTRSKIALFVVHFYFGLIGLLLIGAPLYNLFVTPDRFISIRDSLAVLSGVLSGPFGFVVGYYFKGSERE